MTICMMLELMMVRPKERRGLVGSAAELVVDGQHGYRSRRGANVMMLDRPLRYVVGSCDAAASPPVRSPYHAPWLLA